MEPINPEDIHDFVVDLYDDEFGLRDELEAYVKDAAQNDSSFAAALQLALDEQAEEPECINVEMLVTFEDGAEVSVAVSSPDKTHAIAALMQTGSTQYLQALAASLDGDDE